MYYLVVIEHKHLRQGDKRLRKQSKGAGHLHRVHTNKSAPEESALCGKQLPPTDTFDAYVYNGLIGHGQLVCSRCLQAHREETGDE